MIEVTQFLKSKGGRKSEEPGFKVKLNDNNELIVKLFKGDKFQFLLEVNEIKELINTNHFF